MATYVLVPGAWLGGWAWQEVSERLRGAGHEVYPITLTGLGERSHLAHPQVDLETHIADVVNTLIWNDLRDVILAGHSYSGAVVAGVADRAPERIMALVFVDTGPLADGQALTDLFSPDGLAALRQVVEESGDGWRIPFPGFAALGEQASVEGLDAAAGALLDARATAQPWATYTQPLRLENDGEVSYEQVVIACDDIRGLVAAGIPPVVALTQRPFRYVEMATGHWPMLSLPAALAEVLAGLGDAR